MSEIADILDRAADLIEPEGAWIQGSHHEVVQGRDCYCAMGALNAVRQPIGDELSVRVWNFLRCHVGGSVVAFNDAPGRTQAEVVAKLREAAAKARGEAG